jgi:hypothetical protein
VQDSPVYPRIQNTPVGEAVGAAEDGAIVGPFKEGNKLGK